MVKLSLTITNVTFLMEEVKFILHKCFENGIYTKNWYNKLNIDSFEIVDKQKFY